MTLADNSFQNVLGIWAYFYWAILVYPEGPDAYFKLVRTPCKTAYETGKLGAIMMADILMVGLLSIRLLAVPRLIQ